MRPAHALRPLVLGLLVAALAACGGATGDPGGGDGGNGDGGNGDGNGGSKGGDLCAAISADEVADIVGLEVTETQFLEEDCSYTVGDANLVNVRNEGSFDASLEAARLICQETEPVSVGEEAVWCPDINVLYFNKGGESYATQLVFILDEPNRSAKEIAVDIATKVAQSR